MLSGNKQWAPPGHFYSPIPSLEEVKKREGKLFNNKIKCLGGIELNEREQLKMFEIFKEYYPELPFKAEKTEGSRYFYENPAFSYSDAICLYSMIRYAKPKRIIEVGSGYSSCVILDVNEAFFKNEILCEFIEPYPQLLKSLIKDEDEKKVRIIPSNVQEIDLKVFEKLSAGDILFIDSTHVSKIGSDVNFILFEVLPVLKAGVYIQFHDIFYPFEYPKQWIYEGRAWNEDYLLRAFLQYNRSFQIIFFNSFMHAFHSESFVDHMPLHLKNKGGSIWLKKLKSEEGQYA